MPFINLDYYSAKEAVEQQKPLLLQEFLQVGTINPREFEILQHISVLVNAINISVDLANETKEYLKEVCKQYFDEPEKAYNSLVTFAEKRTNVSWVLFSRTWQFIPYSEINPLEGYLPRMHVIKKIVTKKSYQFPFN